MLLWLFDHYNILWFFDFNSPTNLEVGFWFIARDADDELIWCMVGSKRQKKNHYYYYLICIKKVSLLWVPKTLTPN